MNAERIAQLQSGQRFGGRVFHHAEIASTNDLALAEIDAGRALDGDLFVADRQTKGRGTKERSWQSERADGLWLSLVLMRPSRAQPLPFLPAVALADLLQQDFSLPAHIKWPNDLLIHDRKVAGILIESRSSQAETAFVVGIGLNLHQESFAGALADRATSLKMERVQEIDREAILIALLRRLSHLDERAQALHEDFKNRSRMFGATIETFTGTRYRVLDLSPEGYLIVMNKSGDLLQLISSGDAEIAPGWLRSAPPFQLAPPLW